MKMKLHHILLLAVSTAMLSCKKDNYQAPSSTLSGKIVYKGEPIQVEYNQVPFQLYQYGFGKLGPINGTFATDGSYSVLLFDGDYKFIVPNGKGPFMWSQTTPGIPDSLSITVSGSKKLDIEVMPYYLIRTAQLSASGGKVTGTFKVEQIITGANAKNIESVGLYINKTIFVSPADNISNTSLAGPAIADPNNISLSVNIPNIVPAQNYVFARIGLKIAGVENRIFSPVAKIQF
jgi:hypothetical protein